MTKRDHSLQYKDEHTMLVAVDCIVFGFDNEELKLLVIKRDFEPEKGKWSLIGGFIKEQETSDDAAQRVTNSLTGLENIYLEQVHTFTHPQRDPALRTISIAYYALIKIDEHNKDFVKKYSAKWFPLNQVPELIFDHPNMLNSALNQLRHKIMIKPIGFELLPKKFTMRQLHKLYEAILSTEVDKRNFTKKINHLDILIRLKEKDMNSSKKGSYLYKFDLKKYEHYEREGYFLNKIN